MDLIKFSTTKYYIITFNRISEFILKTFLTEITGRRARLVF